MTEVKYPEVHVQISDDDGNIFVIAGRVGRALKKAGLRSEAQAFYRELSWCKSYDEALRLVMVTVETS